MQQYVRMLDGCQQQSEAPNRRFPTCCYPEAPIMLGEPARGGVQGLLDCQQSTHLAAWPRYPYRWRLHKFCCTLKSLHLLFSALYHAPPFALKYSYPVVWVLERESRTVVQSTLKWMQRLAYAVNSLYERRSKASGNHHGELLILVVLFSRLQQLVTNVLPTGD